MSDIVGADGRQAYSSVELTKNTKGYSWAVKVYVPAGEESNALPIVRQLEHQLREEYGARE